MAATTGRVLSFDGVDDRVDFPGAALPRGKHITISFWSFGGPNQPRDDTSFSAVDTKGIMIVNIHIPWSNGNVYFDCGTQTSNRILRLDAEESYRGSWVHWAFTKNADLGVMQIFRNGTSWHAANGMKLALRKCGGAKLGCFIHNELAYEGRFSDLRIWNCARNADEIRSDMNRRLRGDEEGLVGYWPLDEGQGTTVYDKTDNANHGTIHGATWEEAAPPIHDQHGMETPVAAGYGYWWRWRNALAESRQLPAGTRRGRIWS